MRGADEPRGGHSIGGGSAPLPRRHHDRRTTLLWVLCVGGTLFDVLLFVGVLLGGNSDGNSVAGGLLGVAIIALVPLIAGLSARRRGRRGEPAPSSDPSQRVTSTPSTWGLAQVATGPGRQGPWGRSSRRGGEGRRRWSKDPRWVLSILLVLFLAGGVTAVADFRDAERSTYTQTHGIRVTGLVGAKDNNADCGRSGCSHTFSAPVDLTAPVDGRMSTTLHGQGRLEGGSIANILIDPREPDYAELPGDKLHAAGSWIGYAVGSLFFLLVLMLLAYRILRLRFGPPPGSAPPGAAPWRPASTSGRRQAS